MITIASWARRTSLVFGLTACGEGLGTLPDHAPSERSLPALFEASVDEGPVLDVPCDRPSATSGRLVVTTTDFATGALSSFDPKTGEVRKDLALASTDTAPRVAGGRLFVVQRYMYDYVSVYENDDGLTPAGEWPVVLDVDRSANPQSLVWAQGRVFVSVLGASELQVFAPGIDGAFELEKRVSLSSEADADGIAEPGLLVRCGGTVFAGVSRVDQSNGWTPVDHPRLVPVRAQDGVRFGASARDGSWPRSLTLLGTRLHDGYALDPNDPRGHTIFVLTSGLERVDLARGEVSFAIAPEVFEAAGLKPLQLARFAVDADGDTVWLTAGAADFSEYGLFRASLSRGGEDLVQTVGGLHTVLGAFALLEGRLYFLDNRVGNSGLRIFDLQAPVTEITTKAIGMGLPPYDVAVLP